jgi:hypothetical protein
MLRADATELYDLAEAGALLFADPARLRRLSEARRIPAAWVEEGLGLPVPWVEAEAGRSPEDPDALARYWLERLAPPAPEARRPVRDRASLAGLDLLTPSEAAARVCADPAALARMGSEGTLPALRVDGESRFDAALVALVAAEDGTPEAAAAADLRRSAVARLARFEYATGLSQGARPPATARREAPPAAAAVAPRAWTLPEDLVGPPAPPAGPPAEGPGRLIEAAGFEVAEEDP